MKDPYSIILQPHITEKSMAMSYGDPRERDEANLQRKYTFIVSPSANKIEIKQALEAIYNEGKKKGDAIVVESVRTVRLPGKVKRVRGAIYRAGGAQPDRKKAIITLKRGQILEDYGV